MNGLQANSFYTAALMDWQQVRAHFKAERERLKLTQDDVAERGNVDQSRVSKIESDPDYRPQADTFLSAIEGLGLPLSDFFLQLERQTNADSTRPVKSTSTYGHAPNTGGAHRSGVGVPTDPASTSVVRSALVEILDGVSEAIHRLDQGEAKAATPQRGRSSRAQGDRRSRR